MVTDLHRRVRENKKDGVQENDSRSCCEAVPEEECAEIQYVSLSTHFHFLFVCNCRIDWSQD